MGLQLIADAVAAKLVAGTITSKGDLHKAKSKLCKAAGIVAIPKDNEIVPLLPQELQDKFAPILRTKPMRSQSGVAILAVMSSPAGCPHGKCVYCPGGPEVDAPQSYTGFEPSTMRAKRFNYDPYRIARSRMGQLEKNSHATNKVDVVIQGGTFPAREDWYRDWFVTGIYEGCNEGPLLACEESFDDVSNWAKMTYEERTERLEDAKARNENAPCRVIGLTVETKPDWCLEEHIDDMLRYGATRIELGIQTLDEETTQFTNRGHTMQDSIDSMRVARDAGFKVCVHMMPGLPRPPAARAKWLADSKAIGRATEVSAEGDDAFHPIPEMDVEDMRRLYAEPEWRPDMIKIYPTLVVMEGETPLKMWWKKGKFDALDTEGAKEVVVQSFPFIPEYCRIQRIDRDIPTTHVEAGVMNSNLRQLAEEEADKRGIDLREIRRREVSRRIRDGVEVDPKRLEIVRRDYEASGGLETFLSFEDPVADAIVGFIRLRRVGPNPHRPEFQHERGTAVVRELKIYGVAQVFGEHETDAWQHTGLGKRLLEAAEEIAAGWGVGRILVIAGVGVKEYYRNQGYVDLGPYVAKECA